jgi:phosphinothricin acetyltransferase
MEIRAARADDADEIMAIHNQSIPAGTAEWTESLHTVEGRARWLADKEAAGWPVFVAVDADRVIGTATYGDFRDSSCREGFRFTVEHSVYVDEEFQGRGVAGALMDVLEDEARSRGLRVMIGAIDAANEGSLAFHARRGYVEVGRLPDVGHTWATWRSLVLVQLRL